MTKIIECPPNVQFEDRSESFASFLTNAMDLYAPNGKGIKQIRQAVKIMGIVEQANGTLTLEDADYEVVKAAVESCAWKPQFARKALPFFEAVEAAKDAKA